MKDTSVDEMLRPVRVYTDIPQSLDIALKVHCAMRQITRKQYLAEIIREELIAKGAIAREVIKPRQQKKG